MTKQQIIDWAIGRGWVLDKWGHLQRGDLNGYRYRLKLSKNSLRYEQKLASAWIRLTSGFYKDLYLDERNRLTGLKRRI